MSRGREVVSPRAAWMDDMDHPEERDPELGAVLTEVSRRLAALETTSSDERDRALVFIEAYAGPYAIAFFYEIERLEALIATRRTHATSRRT